LPPYKSWNISFHVSLPDEHATRPHECFYTLNRRGSRDEMSELVGLPSRMYSDINLPVAGPFWMPQHVCPAANHRPGTDVAPMSGPESCCGR